jgi:predicted transcriptional regulator of viral defense system
MIEQLFQENHGFATTKELKSHGFHHYQINELLAQETISKIKHGVYKWNEDANDTDELLEVARLAPKGVVCLLSAALYYELTTFVPAQYQIAIPRKDKITLPEYPPIKLFYWSDVSYQLGQQFVKIDDDAIAIYDIEKTVCDSIKYRDKIGLDTCKEIIRNYLNREDRDLVKISDYAKKMNLSGIVLHLLTILV